MSWAGKELFADRIRSLFRQKEQAPSSKQPSKPGLVLGEEDLERIEPRVKEWVRGRGYRLPDRSLAQTAARMGLSWEQLYAFCSQRLQKDFRAWRTELRIRDAQEQLLQEPQTSAATIARRVGYNDRSNFSRHFFRVTGTTPAQWRKAHEASSL